MACASSLLPKPAAGPGSWNGNPSAPHNARCMPDRTPSRPPHRTRNWLSQLGIRLRRFGFHQSDRSARMPGGRSRDLQGPHLLANQHTNAGYLVPTSLRTSRPDIASFAGRDSSVGALGAAHDPSGDSPYYTVSGCVRQCRGGREMSGADKAVLIEPTASDML
jgi:hypothetical protein